MSFYLLVKDVLDESDFAKKEAKFDKLYNDFLEKKFEFEPNFTPKPLEVPSFAKICKILPAKDLPSYKGAQKEASFLHSIAHIEYSAIDIALDDCYRFVNLPFDYYKDWLEVAKDEIRHFKKILEELEKTGYKYGDFAVHDGLFFAMKKTQNSLVERMAVLHRYMEANGLDANFFMLNKIKNDKNKTNLTNLLNIILKEEISHVQKGDRWYKFACKAAKVDESLFLDIIIKHYPNFTSIKRELNVEARLEAGFSKDEIRNLQNIGK
ncbi:ferritin-like domain-containing protein [Campylobacter geochelonis]|uniref:COG2833: uncharacterized protein n=1 Tax=Campylobacter geochelonis TaxID=1780362 RepID=A0A128EIE1_9BACT|nr:ferritin-like domain-containing protein [Campylobacter geochelonis]QKF71297.1 DUF455 domain-containing protein [Campylobacter geochelonis]CZE48098.1 COG2833: uncharacterized protein [Campylobacter geochelonis]CZE48171.1 COG2833: uncharacterized protein [Campylobacter geochelonis]